MRRQLTELEDDQIGDVITYGCSAHLINLFAKDIEEAEIKSDVKKIIKYFKYHHFPQAKYKEAGGKALVLPQDVRRNTLADCLESYVNNWHCLVKVCSEHRSVLDLTIVRNVQDVEFKENVENYVKKLKKVAIALDLIQKDLCVLSNCTHIWKDLLSSDWLPEEADKLKARFKAAMTPAHFAAYILDPNYNGNGLSEEEDTIGMEFLDSSYPNAMKDVLAYRARSYPFLEYMFKKDLLMKTHVSVWWKSVSTKVDPGMLDITCQLFTATASSAEIERLFSSFGLVHSKLRNKLGTEKAAKLVAIMRALNPP
ncbi:hypothetical protein EVAR_50331_1 [Eumeta japonica]|uniref:HAT C-terminal dimerisation domain-containing protein n=1 Tax=Eumeta variegata TaxID=151549 RepID=A0A4C1XRI2_EUMVA|nr:hypothetical protein EVAR_50331_1 [Eumeta japonica]